MLNIYISENVKTKTDRTVSKIRKTDSICDDSWINLIAPSEEEIAELVEKLDVPEEFLRSPLDDEERPRIDTDEDTDSLLMIVDIPLVKDNGRPDLLETVPLGIIIKKRQIITVSLRDVKILNAFAENQVKDCKVGYRNRFAIQIMYAAAGEFLRLLRQVDKSIESSEKELAKITTNKELYRLLDLSKTLVYFSTSLKSDEAVLEKLNRGPTTIRTYEEDEELLDDVIIEFKQAMEMADIYMSVVSHTLDAYASIINNNMNDIMKIMAAATIALSVPTIISSFFGQNCVMPWDAGFSSHPVPFFVLLASGIFSIGVAIVILRKHRML
ncbi:MAG: magnesium transporter CorA family protein [Clostridiales bacterium]|nr:magnesium transporter CorA family protein [Clostridiales bacterium]